MAEPKPVWWLQALTGNGSSPRLPRGRFRLNMRKSDLPWRVVLQENRLPQRVDGSLCLEVFTTWLNKAARDLL